MLILTLSLNGNACLFRWLNFWNINRRQEDKLEILLSFLSKDVKKEIIEYTTNVAKKNIKDSATAYLRLFMLKQKYYNSVAIHKNMAYFCVSQLILLFESNFGFSNEMLLADHNIRNMTMTSFSINNVANELIMILFSR